MHSASRARSKPRHVAHPRGDARIVEAAADLANLGGIAENEPRAELAASGTSTSQLYHYRA